MIKIHNKIPRSVGGAVSGGVDSMAVLDFLQRNHDVHVLHFNHGTEHGHRAMAFLVDYCQSKGLPYSLGFIRNDKPQDKSWEEHWRDERYAFLTRSNMPVVLGHHLDDCVETYVFNMCHGKDHTIPYSHANCVRPFRLTHKSDLVKWAKDHDVPWIDDPSNENTDYTRNLIRKELLPRMLKVNPGIHKVIYKRLKSES